MAAASRQRKPCGPRSWTPHTGAPEALQRPDTSHDLRVALLLTPTLPPATNPLPRFRADHIPQCQYILDNSKNAYALLLAATALTKLITAHWNNFNAAQHIDIRYSPVPTG